MKIHFKTGLGACAALIFCVLPPLRAQPASLPEANPYELMSRTLLPIASVFSPQAARHALCATLRLEAMTGLPPEMAGTRLELAVQPPARVLIRGPFGGQTVTVCRVGQNVWISPGSILRAALDPRPQGNEAKAGKEAALVPLALPFSPQELALLPALCQVTDAGEANGMRLLDVRLIAEIARKLGIEAWTARLFITPAGGEGQEPKLVGFEIARPGWHLAVRVERLRIDAELPESQWEPAPSSPVAAPTAPEQSGVPPTPDVLRLSGPQIRRWVDAIARQMTPGANTP